MDRKQQNDYLVNLVKQSERDRQARLSSAKQQAASSARLTRCFSDETWAEVDRDIRQSEADTQEYITKRRMLG